MIKIKLFQNVGLGVAGAAAMVGSAFATGCSAEPAQDAQASSESNELNVGSGTLALHGFEVLYSSTSNGDEFIRAGERLRATLELNDALHFLENASRGAAARIGSDASKVSVKVRLTYKGTDGSTRSVDVPASWSPSHGTQVATSDEFVVPARTPRMTVAYVLQETGQNEVVVGDGWVGHASFAIFGAYTPDKLALWDNDARGGRRLRVVEGGALAPGANVTLSYTDWRSDREIDKSSLDLVIGEGQSFSRFGMGIFDVKGDLKYDVSFVYSVDGGQTWVDGGLLEEHVNPDVLSSPGGSQRKSYEKTFRLPQNARGLLVAFHVEAYMIADPHYVFIRHWKPGIELGKKYKLRDIWDNNDGDNYSIEVSR